MSNHSPLTIDHVELTPVPGEPRAYFYRPVAAGIASDANGKKQISLIEAGPVAMLALTGMWGVEGTALEAVRGKLAAQLNLADPKTITLRPALVDVGDVELRLSDGAGNLKPFLKTTSSGMPPYPAAFNSMLTAEQTPTVKRALKGERGLLRLRYTVVERPVKQQADSFTQDEVRTTSTTTITRGLIGDETTIRRESRTETGTDSETPTPQSSIEPQYYETDAADWGLPS